MCFVGFLSCESDPVQLGNLDLTVDFILLYPAEGLQMCQLKALSFVKHLWCGVVSDFFFLPINEEICNSSFHLLSSWL